MTVDLGNKCVHCKEDTSFGSGKFVNRYPVFGLDADGTGTEYDGYCCDECEQAWYDEQKRNKEEN
jgi:hypothetical protein